MNRYTTFLSLLINLLSFQNVYANKRIENPSSVANIAEIPLTLMAKDKSSGMQLSPKFTVVAVKGGNPLAIKEKDGQLLVSVQVGQSYKIKAELEGHLKKLQANLKEAQDRLMEEQTAHGATRDALSASEKRYSKTRKHFTFVEI